MIRKIWGYLAIGGVFITGIWVTFKAGEKSESNKRDSRSLKRKEDNRRKFDEIEGDYEEITDVNDAIDRLNALSK